MNLPITYKELETIITTIKNVDKDLYAKLWSYKFALNNKKVNGVK
jgi:hypothetical protein